MRIEIVSGSPRQQSVTHRVALHLETQFSNGGIDAGVIDLRENQLPFIQAVWTSPESAPAEHRELAKRMFAADAFVVVTPEYNGTFSAAVANLFDHFPKQARKAFGIATASPGALGGIRAALHLQQYIYGLFGIGSPFMLVTPGVDKKFDAEGNLTDPAFEKSVQQFVQEFLWLSQNLKKDTLSQKAAA